MLTTRRADYGDNLSQALAPLEGDIAAEAEHDEALLLLKQTPIAGGLGVVILPNPLPTPAATIIALLPTPTPTPATSEPPEAGPVTPAPAAPTATSVAPPTAPPPVSSPPASPPTAPPASPPPTSLPPTAPPTVPPTLPPSTPPPTSPPSTSPPTSPPSTSPPISTPTPTASPTATATATATPPATPTNTPTPLVQFSLPTYTVIEGNGAAPITVTLSTASALAVTVNYTVSDGSPPNAATNGADYIPATGVLTFAPGVTSQVFTVTILTDSLDELDETALLTLSAPTNAALGTPNSATLTITDDDAPPAVQFSAASYTVGEADGTASITVTLSTASALTVTVDYTTSGITAMAGVGFDYLDSGGTLTFDPGQTSRIFYMTILTDSVDEPLSDETIELRLINPINNASFGAPVTATLAIMDDDLPTGTCSDNRPAGEPGSTPNADPMNPATFARVGCGLTLTVPLMTPINMGDRGSFDFIYYEVQGTNPVPSPPEQIYMDLVIIEVGQSSSGPWYRVFYWGDTTLDTNTNIGQAPPPGPYGPPEDDNTLIPMTTPPLYGTAPYTTGIAIDIDGLVPPGTYQYVRIYSPPGGSDGLGPEVDAIEVLP